MRFKSCFLVSCLLQKSIMLTFLLNILLLGFSDLGKIIVRTWVIPGVTQLCFILHSYCVQLKCKQKGVFNSQIKKKIRHRDSNISPYLNQQYSFPIISRYPILHGEKNSSTFQAPVFDLGIWKKYPLALYNCKVK